jgi:biopolymer transport protein ExbD
MSLRRDRPTGDLDSITPLINVAFLLLAFFMMIGKFDAGAPFDVYPPISRAATEVSAGGTTLSISRTGDLAFEGQAIDRTALPAVFRSVVAEDETKAFVRINADAAAPARAVLAAIDALDSAGASQVVLLVTPPDQSRNGADRAGRPLGE